MTATINEVSAELERVKQFLAANFGLDLRSDEEKKAAEQAAADEEKAAADAPPATAAAAALAEASGVDLAQVEPTGASGQVTVADVKAADATA